MPRNFDAEKYRKNIGRFHCMLQHVTVKKTFSFYLTLHGDSSSCPSFSLHLFSSLSVPSSVFPRDVSPSAINCLQMALLDVLLLTRGNSIAVERVCSIVLVEHNGRCII